MLRTRLYPFDLFVPHPSNDTRPPHAHQGGPQRTPRTRKETPPQHHRQPHPDAGAAQERRSEKRYEKPANSSATAGGTPGDGSPPIRRASKLYSPRPSSAVASELMTPAAGDALNEAVKRAELKSHREARELLAEHGAAYADESGIHRLFKRHGIRSKAGRYQHEKSDPEVVAVFEKLRSAHSGEHPHGPGRPPGAGDGPG